MSSSQTSCCPSHALNRREMMGLGAAAAISGAMSLAPQTASAGSTEQPSIVDVHYHVYPPQMFAEANSLADQVRNLSGVKDWDAARASDQLDADGVSTAIISFANPVFWSSEREAQRRLTRLCNDYFAQVRRDNKGRFGFYAALTPLVDTEGALAEIAYAMDVLGADGVRVMTSYNGEKWLGDASFDPVWEELDRRGCIVFVHPDLPCQCASVPSVSLELPFDTARAAFSLWRSGAFSKYPRIRFILSHGGGPVPMLIARFNGFGRPGPDGSTIRDADTQLRGAWFDTAQAAGPSSMNALLTMADHGRILFGSDKPFGSPARQAAALASIVKDEVLLQAIRRGNAEALMPGLFKTS